MREAARLKADVEYLAASWRPQRAERQRRRTLDKADFDQLAQIGLHKAAVPVEHGGLWEGPDRSVRPLCEALRCLAGADPSVALAASMHPGVLAFWRDCPDVPDAGRWEAQKRDVYQTVVDGVWWGTIASEAGSGGDIGKTRARARRDGANPHAYRITGDKHFGSGSGATAHMLTIAVPEGESEPAWFYLDVRGVPWDGSRGMTLTSAWDAHGMRATNSHAFSFTDFPATRLAWPGHWRDVLGGGGSIPMFFTAVIVGIVDVAMEYMRAELTKRGPPAEVMRAFDSVVWVMAEREAWLALQAYEGGIRAVEAQGRARREAALAKVNVASLAESVLTRLARLSGGSAFSRHSPLGFWFEDVRALGFLRPPWSLAQEALFEMSWQS